MRAALLTAHNAPLELVELQPEQLQYGQVLVRILASGICGAQLMEIDGSKVGGPLPHPLGHEGAGVVEEVGPAVRQVKVGQKVCCHWRKGDGIESDYPRYKFVAVIPSMTHMKRETVITSGKVTTFADYSVCSENRLTPVPNDTPLELVALLGCGLSTALGTIEQEANLKMGESVLIIGCGGLGLNLILAAKMRQASVINVRELNHSKRASAFAMGATYFNAEENHFDVVIDTTGDATAFEYGVKRVAPSGRFIMVGQPKGDLIIWKAAHMFEGTGKTIKATQGGGFNPSVDVPRYVRLHQAGLLNLDGIISHRVSLENINDGIDLVRNGQAGRVLIIP